MRILTWPFRMLFSLIGFVFSLTGRLVAAVLGLALVIVGIVVTCTMVGAVVGVPLIVLGGLLLLRAIF